MKISINLNDGEIKEALLEYVKSKKNVDVKSVTITYHQGDYRDPRESGMSHFSAVVSE